MASRAHICLEMRPTKAIQALDLWIDPVPRTGPDAMAIDEWLLQQAQQALLRVYRWSGAWVSFGYFDSLAKARASFDAPELQYVRRWTGGGVVDHRSDWTYTLILPRGEPLAEARGPESYAAIHAALAEALEQESQTAIVLAQDSGSIAAACFENPVKYDLADYGGRKLAGAGQRRTKYGLLHQGSVGIVTAIEQSEVRAKRLADSLACETRMTRKVIEEDIIQELARVRYGDPEWTNKRP